MFRRSQENKTKFCCILQNLIIQQYNIFLTNEKCWNGEIDFFLSACQSPGHQGYLLVPSCPTIKILDLKLLTCTELSIDLEYGYFSLSQVIVSVVFRMFNQKYTIGDLKWEKFDIFYHWKVTRNTSHNF